MSACTDTTDGQKPACTTKMCDVCAEKARRAAAERAAQTEAAFYQKQHLL